jgi:hypothetical protein
MSIVMGRDGLKGPINLKKKKKYAFNDVRPTLVFK